MQSNEQKIPGRNARPSRPMRAVVYPAYARTGPSEPLPGTRPIYLYLRLSKYHKDKADAIERQRLDLVRKLAAEGGWTVMGEFIDNDSASSSAARSRKGWKQLNEGIASGTVKAIAFWKLDRTNRIATKCIEWIAECQRASVYLVSHQDSAEELNTATAGAKIVTGIKALLAEVETDSMSERQLAAKRHLAEAGFHHGGTRPFGWQPGPRVTDEFGRTGIRLVPHPVEHQALKDAVDMVLQGRSLGQIARHWKDAYGITTADGAYVYEATIYRSLCSPRMVGYRMFQVPEHRRGVKIDLLDYVARDAQGEPVIAQEPACDWTTWLRVRHLLSEASNNRTIRPWGTHQWLLTGLLYCQCGARLYGHSKTRRAPDGTTYPAHAYRCMANRLRGPGNCSGGCTIDAVKGEAFVLGWFFSQITPEALETARQRRAAAGSRPDFDAVMEQLRHARAERTALVDKQGTAGFQGAMVQVLLSMIGDVQARIETLERELDTIELQSTPIGPQLALPDRWAELDILERRRYLRHLVRRIDALPGKAPTEARLVVRSTW